MGVADVDVGVVADIIVDSVVDWLISNVGCAKSILL